LLFYCEDIYSTFEKSYGKDKAESMYRSMIEGTLADIVSAFQKYAEEVYKQIMPTKRFELTTFK